jgi:AmpD protein
MQIDANGWLDAALAVPSPNFDARPDQISVELLVVHAISLPPGEFGGPYIHALFQNRLEAALHPYFQTIDGLKVSTHFLIDRAGRLFQFVACNQRAWHAGASVWQGRERCNDFSIGIELEGCDDMPFTNDQYIVLKRLANTVCRHFPIRDVVGHSDIAPDRKTDPGPFFDWTRLGKRGMQTI